jgi:hypothetical protein
LSVLINKIILPYIVVLCAISYFNEELNMSIEHDPGNHQIIKRLSFAAGALGAMLIPGAIIGALVDAHDRGNVPKAEDALSDAELDLYDSSQALNTFRMETPAGCVKILDKFAGVGVNSNMEAGAAQLLVNDTRQCPQDNLTSVVTYRMLNDDLAKADHSQRAKRADLDTLRNDARSHSEIWKGSAANFTIAAIGSVIVRPRETDF